MNKSINIALILSILFLFSCNKESYDNMQRNSFVKFFGSQYQNSANDVVEQNGDYIFVGFSRQNPLIKSGYIVKTNEFGNAQWISYSTLFGSVELNGITIGNDQSYVVCGQILDTTGQIDLYVAKYGQDGSLIWENSFGGIENQSGNKIIPANDGGYIIIGSTTAPNAGNTNPAGVLDMMAVKIDENGDSLITNQFGGIKADVGNDLISISGNQYLAVGTTANFTGTFASFHGGDLIYLVMLSNQLGEDDVYCWGDLDNQYGNSISYDNNGNFLIAGANEVGGEKDGYLLNIDGNNIRSMINQVIISVNDQEELFDAREQTDGTICATGTTDIGGIDKIGVFKINSSNLSLDRDASFDLGYTGVAVGNRVIATQNGGFLIAASSLFELNSIAALIKLNDKVEL